MKGRPIVIAFFAVLAVFHLSYQLQAQKRKTKPPPRTTSRIVKLGTVTVNGGETPEGLTPQQKVRWDSFIKVWSTLNDNYFDQTYNGLDWNKVKAEYRPRVIAAKSDPELHQMLSEMIKRLNRSHFAIIPPEVLNAFEDAKREAKKREQSIEKGKGPPGETTETDEDKPDVFDEHSRFGIGVDLRMLDGQFVITYVDPNSSAHLAGIKRGYIIDKINGFSLSEMVSRIVLNYPDIRNLYRYLPIEVVSWFLNGKRDSTVAVTCLDEKDQPREFSMKRLPLEGSTVSISPSLPPQFLAFESRSLDPPTGYIRFNLFSLDVIEKFCNALTEFRDKKALVIDLRGNLGGLFGVLGSVSGMLSDRRMNFGTSIYRSRTEPFDVIAKAKHFSGRIVLIVDNQSVSAAELFASGMRENNRAIVVGTTTGGEALPASMMELPTGARFMFPVANFKSRDGKLIEGNGVVPDYAVPLDRKHLLSDIDAPLDKARALIRENKEFLEQKPEMPLGLVDSDAPPPPKKSSQGSGISSAAPTLSPSPEIKDAKAISVIADFLKVFNADEYKTVNTYEAVGVGEVTSLGTLSKVDIRLYRQSPDKFAFVMKTLSVGEFREVYTEKSRFLESDIGYRQELPIPPTAYASELFGPIAILFDLDKFKSLKYLGVFDRDGRQCHIIEGKVDYMPVALAFDVETKLLVSVVAYGSPTAFGNYRKVNGMMLPFHVALERVFDVNLNEIKINVPVDEVHFKRKENCFDKPL